jgi:hypothetical protein
MTGRFRTFGDDRGAILVHVALSLLALMAFTAFSIDYGVLWASRRQAQNAADAGALAGAIAYLNDPAGDQNDTGPSKQTAYRLTQTNLVWGESPNVDISSDITFPTCPDDGVGTCIRVDVYRTQSRGNALPMFFGMLFGSSQQDIRAMAMAKLGAGNSSKCLKPWGLADKWEENNPVVGATWDPSQTFDPTGGNPDVYVPQNGTDDPGSGFRLPDDYGFELTLKYGDPHDTINPGWFQALDLDGGGASDYRDNISGCAGILYGIGDDVPKENGNMVGPTQQGVDDLLALDPNADWDPLANGGKGAIVGSCVTTGNCPGGHTYSESPRIVAIPIFNLDLYLATGGPGNGTVRITNILGFFIDEMVGNDVHGYLVTKPELYTAGKGSVAPGAGLTQVIYLIR